MSVSVRMGPSHTVSLLLSALLGWSQAAPNPAPAHGMIHLPMVHNYPLVYNYPLLQTVNNTAVGGFFFFPGFQSPISQTKG